MRLPHYFLIFMIFLMFFMLYASRYRNPYKLVMIFGKKGSGKSTLMTKIAVKALKKKKCVYSSTPIPGCYLIDPTTDIGFNHIPPDSVILIDEVGTIWDNRNFKAFKPEVRDYFKYQRHYRHTVYLFSQTFDVDIKLRNLTDNMYLVRSFMNVFSVARRVNRTIKIVHPSAEGESRIADDMEFDNILLFWAGAVKFTFIPAWIKYFDSFSTKELTDKEYELCPAVNVRHDLKWWLCVMQLAGYYFLEWVKHPRKLLRRRRKHKNHT